MSDAPILVVAWDGACLEVTQPLVDAGRMPVLAALQKAGRVWRVESTVPAVTFPAWTSFLTGARPDHHGITDFTIPRDGGYGVRFVNAGHRALPTLVTRLSEAGVRVGMYGIPATFPPEGRGVFEICGFDTPLGSASASRAAHPPGLADKIRQAHGRLGIEGIPQSRIDAGWHDRTLPQLLADIALRTNVALDLWRSHRLDVFLVHFMESDTVGHHFWQFHDPDSPLHRAGPRSAVARIYQALDASLGQLLEAVGPQASVLLLSDHGSSGASDRTVFWNRWLSDQGWLGFDEAARVSLAVHLKRAALRFLPPAVQAKAFSLAGGMVDRLESSSRFAGIDWSRTRAFSDEVPYFPSIRLNLAGREKSGVVDPSEREDVLLSLTSEILAARDPLDGFPVVETVRRREELFDGPYLHRYPDLVLDLRRPGGYAYGAGSSRSGREKQWLRRLRREEATGAKGSATSGVHSPWGMAVLRSAAATVEDQHETASTSQADLPECTLADLGVTVLALAGVEPSEGMQGRPIWIGSARGEDRSANSISGLPTGEVVGSGAWTPQQTNNYDYSEEEEREVEERLRALGYLP